MAKKRQSSTPANKNRLEGKVIPYKPPIRNKESFKRKIHKYMDETAGKYIIPAIIFISCFVLYGNTLLNDYAFDDSIYTTHNIFIVKGFSCLKDIFDKACNYGFNKDTSSLYRPLTLLNFMAETSLFGFNPHISHFFNILFFALTGLVLYLLLKRILIKYNPAIVLAATLLFVYHPIHTEVVANIKSRDEILGVLFGLTSFYLLRVYEEQKKALFYIVSVFTFTIAIFCKEDCLPFIAIIPLLLYFFPVKKSPGDNLSESSAGEDYNNKKEFLSEIKKITLITIPYFIAVCFYLFIRGRVLQKMTFEHALTVKYNSLMAATNTADQTATSFVLLGKYIYMTIIPYPLSYDYSYNQIPIVSWLNIKPILTVLICIFLIVYMVVGFRKRSIFSFLIALFFITIFLTSNLVLKIAWTFGERFLYMPSLAFCIALPILTAKALQLNPLQLEWKRKIYFYIPIGCLLLVYAIIVIPRNRVWKNTFTLFQSGIITSPNSERVHAAMGDRYIDSALNTKIPAMSPQYYSLAMHELERAKEIYNDDPDCYNNLAACYYNKGFTDSAIMAYKEALKLNPQFAVSADNLGVIYFNKGQYDSALIYFFKSYKADSSNLSVLMQIGTSYQNKNNYSGAMHYDSLVLQKDPGNEPTLKKMSLLYNVTGINYAGKNKLDSALEEFNIALKYDSGSAEIDGNLGGIYAEKGNIEMAKKYFRKALAKDPKNETYARNLQLLNTGPK